jgi:hypothetical protein
MSEISDLFAIGPNGYSTNPRHPSHRAKSRTLQQLHEDYLGALERAGSLLALLEAAEWCWRNRLSPPDWVWIRMFELLANPTRLAKLLKAARRDRRIHLPRWELVKELQERRDELARAPVNLEPTLDAAFENASKALRGTKAAGAPDTIKKSWHSVERRFKARRQD